jgi:hypothetical protein
LNTVGCSVHIWSKPATIQVVMLLFYYLLPHIFVIYLSQNFSLPVYSYFCLNFLDSVQMVACEQVVRGRRSTTRPIRSPLFRTSLHSLSLSLACSSALPLRGSRRAASRHRLPFSKQPIRIWPPARRRARYYTSRLSNDVLSCSASALQLELEVRKKKCHFSTQNFFPCSPAVARRSFLCNWLPASFSKENCEFLTSSPLSSSLPCSAFDQLWIRFDLICFLCFLCFRRLKSENSKAFGSLLLMYIFW